MKAVRAAIGLGSNLGDPPALIRSALRALAAQDNTVLKVQSAIYRSPPLSGRGSQPDYANAVAVIETGLAPLELLEALLGIERTHGRVRDAERWAPRLLDLDVLLYGDLCLDHARLRIPHPEVFRRAFVLQPLAEAVPDFPIPGQGSAGEAYARLHTTPLPVWV